MELYVVDAFTDRAFRGNPAGVVLLDEPAEETWMRSVAAELKHSDTAFVVVGGDDPLPLRWFTPTTEVDLCGHATLATTHVLGGRRRFSTRSGELSCANEADGWIRMDLPTAPVEHVDAPEATLRAALPGCAVRATAALGTDRLLVEAADEQQVRDLRPDEAALRRLPWRTVVVTAPADSRGGPHFVSRMFAPRSGVPEDPVTGSAHCSLAPWWAPRLNTTELVGEQLSARGGTVRMNLSGDRVAVLGQAVTVVRGELLG